MPRVEFVENPAGAAKAVDVPEGGDLIDLCDRVYAPVPFSCRSASCGTCQVEILQGMEHLEAPNELEADLLDILGGPSTTRLACQARIKPGGGLVRLKPLGT